MASSVREMCGRSAAIDGSYEDPALDLSIAAALGRAEERERLKAIVTSEQALQKPAAAAALAFSSDLNATDALCILAALPCEPRIRRRRWGLW